MRKLIALALLLMTAPAIAAAQTSKYGIPATQAGSAQPAVQISPPTTVAGLPVCDISHIGILRIVTDANSPTYNGSLTGGGSSIALVVCAGTTTSPAWKSQ